MVPLHIKQQLEQLAGFKCDLDLFANPNGDNSLCSKYRTRQNTFELTSLQDIKFFANPAYSMITNFIYHILKCKLMDSSVTGVFLVPHIRKASYALLLASRHCELLHTYPNYSFPHTSPGTNKRSRMPCCPWQISAFVMRNGVELNNVDLLPADLTENIDFFYQDLLDHETSHSLLNPC